MSALNRQVEYWNRVGPTKPFSHPINLERLAGLVDQSAPILDVGCGYGRTLEVLQAAGYEHLTGVDIAPVMIQLAQARVPAAAFQLLDPPSGLPFPHETFDAVLLISVLTCIPTDEGQRSLVAEIRRVLRPGGVLCASDVWVQDDERNVERYARDAGRYGAYGCFMLPEGVVVRHHDREWITMLFDPFDTISIDEIDVTTMNGNAAKGFQYFGRAPRS